jgi:hypothetical protein
MRPRQTRMPPVAAFAALGVALFAPIPAQAESSAVARQQQDYRNARAVWEQKRVPPGLASRGFASRGKAVAPRDSGDGRTAMLLQNVEFDMAEGIGFSVKNLVITLEPRRPDAPVDFDKVDSFIIRLHRGELVMRSQALTNLFNRHILDYSPRSLSDVTMQTSKGRLGADGSLSLWSSAPSLPTSFAGTITVSKDNKLIFQLDEISTFGIPVADVLKALNITLPSLIDLDRPGVSVSDFSIELDPGKAFPLPELTGAIAAARLSNEGLHLTFADAPRAEFDPPAGLGASFIWIQSGDPKFYGTVITNARVAITPASTGGRLYFNLYDYRQQLSKAVTRLTEDGMLSVSVP